MASIKADIINKIQGRLTSSGGWELRSGATVYALPHNDAISQILAAQAALAAYVPSWATSPPLVIGGGHPKLLTAVLEEMTPRALAPDVIEWELVWRQHFATPSNTGLIEVGSSVIEEQTNVDINGKALAVNYWGANVHDPLWSPGHNNAECRTISVPRPQPTINITRQETGSPGTKSETYVGSANAAGWTLDPSAPARTWLCTAIRGASKDGGNTYQVQYAFQKKMVGTWDRRIEWIDPSSGCPPIDYDTVPAGADGLQALLIAQVVPMTDFNALSLP